jgi:hypothetical protein
MLPVSARQLHHVGDAQRAGAVAAVHLPLVLPQAPHRAHDAPGAQGGSEADDGAEPGQAQAGRDGAREDGGQAAGWVPGGIDGDDDEDGDGDGDHVITIILVF